MMTNLAKLLNEDQLKELAKSIIEKSEFSFNQNGLQISSKSTDNGLQLSIVYDSSEKQLAKQERDRFLEFIKTIDDNVFVELVESLGPEVINKLQTMLNTDDLELVREACIKFKNAYKQLLVSKIKYYQSCLNKLEN